MATTPTPRKRLKRTEKEAMQKAKAALEAEGVVVRTGRSQTPHRKKRAEQKKAKREKERKDAGLPLKCVGFNLMGEPCKSPPLKQGTQVDGSVPVSGHFCLMHDPDVDPAAWKRRFRGEAEGKQARYMTPMQAMAEAMAKAPALLFKPHLEALGLEWDPETNEARVAHDANGKPRRGATHIGFSREGVAKKSRHKDAALQMKAAEGLSDRLYGKARQAMDLGLGGSEGAPRIPPTFDRAMEVAVILRDCGAMPDESDPVDAGDGGE